MLRFLSRRKARNNYAENSAGAGGGNDRTDARGPSVSGGATSSHIKPQRIPVNKNKIDCRVILLDNTDLSIECSVSEIHTRPLNSINIYLFINKSLVGIDTF